MLDDTNMPPQISFELRFIGERIKHALHVHHEDIEKLVEEGVRQAIEDAPGLIKASASAAVQQCVKKSIESYFSYGDGQRMINAVVQETMSGILKKFAASGGGE